MDLPEVIAHYLSFPEVTEETPFGPDVLVYKVCGKMFATASPDDVPSQINLKCDPDQALDLRDQYESVIPGYHMNKKHWNTVILDGELSADLVKDLIKHSYTLVVASLKKVDKERIRAALGV